MRRLLASCTALVVACGASPTPAPVADPNAYADPRLGSGGFAFAAGNCFPGASVPSGMVDVGPDTVGPYGDISFLHFDGYWDGDDTIQGFSQLHLSGTGASDFGVLSVMPLLAFDPAKRTARTAQERFDKSTETASPGYYAVTLDDGIRAELTATTHVASHRYTFPKSASDRFLLVDLTHQLGGESVVDGEAHLVPGEQRFSGHLRTSGGMSGGFDLYFEGKTNEPWKRAMVWENGSAPADGTDATGPGASFALELDDSDGAPIQLAIALSFISNAGAAANLAAEEPAPDFDATKGKAVALWRQRLSSVLAYGGSEDDRRMLYSSLHHAFVMPATASDADGTFAYQGHPGSAKGYSFLTEMSLWDSYRTLNPLYTLVAPDRARDVVQSLDAMATLGGSFPKWPLATSDSGSMVGASADVVLSEAYLKGVRWSGAEATYQRLRAAALDATAPEGGRGGRDNDFDDYSKLGYVTADGGRAGSVSVTLEYAQDDFALGNFAAALGHTEDAQTLHARAHGYRKLFDPATGFLRARLADGSLAPGVFDPIKWDNYVEANAWQSLWGAPHDSEGTAALLGGDAKAVAKLEQFFELAKTDDDQRRAYAAANPEDLLTVNRERPYFWAGNEPDLHAPYLFALLGRPDLTQKWLPWIRDTYFHPTPAGLPGNDDGGTMSAWWVFSALGFYPVAGSDVYVVGAPLFPKIALAVSGGTFTIDAPAVSAKNVYVQAVTLDGKPLETPTFRQADLHAGGVLHFDMGDKPSSWGK